MDFTKIKSVKEYIREQEEEENKKVQDEMDEKLEALFLTGEPVTDETLQVFADENSVDVETVKNKIFGLVTSLLTTRDEEETEEDAPVDESVVDSDTDEDEMNLGDEEELKEDDERAASDETEEAPEVEGDESVTDEEPTSEFDIGDKVSFEVENEEHPLASMSLEVIDTDGEFVQCLAENPETGVQSTYWFKSNELKKIPNEVEVNPEGGDVDNVEELSSPADEYSAVQKESISDIIRKNLQLFRG